MTAKGIIIGAEHPYGGIGSGFVWAKELLEFKTEKMVLAYGSGGPARLAFLQGETNFYGESTVAYNNTMKPYVERGEATPVFQLGIMDAKGNVVREPAAPDVPTIKELYEEVYGKEPSGPAWKVCRLLVGSRTFGKALLFPKGTPPEILNILRKAAIDMSKDAKFIDEANKLTPGAPHFIGDELIEAYPEGVSAPSEVIQYMKKVYIEKYNIVFN
jgi:hypothetical protein